MNKEDLPTRIVVEVVSSADVARLENRDEEIRSEVARLESKLDGLHRTIYELIETLGNIRNKR